MKLCSFRQNDRHTFGAIVADEKIVDLKAALGPDAPASLEDLIERAATDSKFNEELARIASETVETIDISDVEWAPPLRRPGKILGVAINNKIGQQLAYRPFANPAFFLKPSSSLTGHGQSVVVREEFGLTHPEPELAVIIGKPGKHIAEENALSHVFGYSIMNDITSPGLKERDSMELVLPPDASGGYRDLLNWRNVDSEDHARSIYLTYHAMSKGTDTFGAFGPWIVTADEIANPNDLAINSYDGTDLVFEDSTANLTFPVERIISHLSKYMTLESGDVIHCGTAMQAAENSKFRTLTDWDIRYVSSPMIVEIETIGRLINPVRNEQN